MAHLRTAGWCAAVHGGGELQMCSCPLSIVMCANRPPVDVCVAHILLLTTSATPAHDGVCLQACEASLHLIDRVSEVFERELFESSGRNKLCRVARKRQAGKPDGD